MFITAAESCTGGLLSQSIVSVPGSSAWFGNSFITYSNISKHKVLGVCIVRLIKLLYDQQKEFLLAVFFGLIIFCIPLLWMNGYSHDADLNLISILTGSLIGISLVFILKKFGKS